jgi:2-methylisocitrate lyase-like PEP mutase family enzyme
VREPWRADVIGTPERHEIFRALHLAPAGFVLPNVWDAGSAVMLANAGFAAIATTSAGIAFSLGRPDYDSKRAHLAVTRAEMFDRVRQIVDAVTVPVNGDLEAGYGDAPDVVAETIGMAIDAGLSGANIEDKDPKADRLYDETLAVERIAAARGTIDARGIPFVLTARTDAFLVPGDNPLAASVRRANLFRDVGADCLYPPGAGDLDVVRTLVREIAGPLNIVTGLGGVRLSPRALIDAGVQRVSVGGAIARSALGFIRECARELRERGTIRFADEQIGQGELNTLFARSK